VKWRVGRKGTRVTRDKETRDRRILYPSQPSDIDEMVEIPDEFERGMNRLMMLLIMNAQCIG